MFFYTQKYSISGLNIIERYRKILPKLKLKRCSVKYKNTYISKILIDFEKKMILLGQPKNWPKVKNNNPENANLGHLE